jgi:DNA-binding Xre family transcriptional regulator
MPISSQLKAKIKATDATLYRIAKDAGVDWGTLQRFLDGSRADIRISTVDKLCECLGLELQPKKKRETRRSS